MILVIDDLRTFPFPARYARTSLDAVAALEAAHSAGTAIDELWLDHDLGILAGAVDDVWPAVNWICERCVWDDAPLIRRVVVHSDNAPGAATLARVLGRFYPTIRVDAAMSGGVHASS